MHVSSFWTHFWSKRIIRKFNNFPLDINSEILSNPLNFLKYLGMRWNIKDVCKPSVPKYSLPLK